MERTFTTPLVDVAPLVVATFWLGLLVGVSFIATPAKFNALSLSLPVALDVGRATFSIYNTIEWTAFALLVVAVVFSGPSWLSSAATFLLALILAVQTIWLLPVLSDRIAEIIAGHDPPRAAYHVVYIGLDVAKGALLVIVARTQMVTLASLIRGKPQSTETRDQQDR